MKRGQSAIEFVVLVSFMLIVFFGFFVIIQGRILELTYQQDVKFLKEANNIVISEVALAATTAPDFEHTFAVPDKGNSKFYINITDQREIVSKYQDIEYVNFFEFNVTGYLNELGKNNTIYRTDGIILFDNGTEVVNNSYAGTAINVNPENCYIADTSSDCNPPTIPTAMVPLCQTFFSLC